MLLITIGCVLQENHAAIVYLSCPEMQIAVLEQNLLLTGPWRPCRGRKSSKYIHYVNIGNLHPKESVCKLTLTIADLLTVSP